MPVHRLRPSLRESRRLPERENRTFAAVACDGCGLAGEVCGDDRAPALLLAHPIGFDRRFWYDVADELGDRFRLILPDARGHGGSARGPCETNVEQLADDLVAILDSLGISRAAVGGCSMGSATAMRLAAAAPERVAWVALANAPARIPLPRERFDASIAAARAGGFPDLARGMLSRWIAPDIRAQRSDWVEEKWAEMTQTTGDGFADAFAALRDSDRTADLAAIAVPALVITGEHDEAFSPEAAAAMAAGLNGAPLSIIAGAGHLAPIEQPALFADALIAFANDADARADRVAD
jgi:3-oxoadipate enol-lactonase